VGTATPLLSLKNLSVALRADEGEIGLLDNVNLTLAAGETVCLVGESGSGKSLTARAILRLLPPSLRITAGELFFGGIDLLSLDATALRRLRGNRISVIFQEPSSSLNPLFTIGDQIGEAITTHQRCRKAEARSKALELLRLVQIADPELRIDAYPHELSGGMCQRAMIATALSCSPDLLIADEPTTALDVTVQAQILKTIDELKARIGMAMLLITHDLGIVAERADRVLIMYAGRIVEEAATVELFRHPLHPYTKGLLQCIPRIGAEGELPSIPESAPSPRNFPSGCRFRNRCPKATSLCQSTVPDLVEKRSDHAVACHYA
jgi:oligopeptide/dipeptide ABC transporter ATP-binding protein